MAKKTIIKDFVQDDSFRVGITHTPPADITGAVLILTMKANVDDVTPVLEVSHTVGDDPDDVAGIGTAYIPVTSTDTSAVPAGAYYASIKRVIGSNVLTICQTGVEGGAPVRVTQTLKEITP